jgi:hypothetical protein
MAIQRKSVAFHYPCREYQNWTIHQSMMQPHLIFNFFLVLQHSSFGVGGEFGVGGKYDNGGRFDLRLPYADQGYVDEDADVMGKMASFFGGANKKKKDTPKAAAAAKTAQEENSKKKKGGWPW